MAMANSRAALLLLTVATLTLASSVQAAYVGGDWISGQAHATYYGGNDASGTQGLNKLPFSGQSHATGTFSQCLKRCLELRLMFWMLGGAMEL
jgi:hypothetical protein